MRRTQHENREARGAAAETAVVRLGDLQPSTQRHRALSKFVSTCCLVFLLASVSCALSLVLAQRGAMAPPVNVERMLPEKTLPDITNAKMRPSDNAPAAATLPVAALTETSSEGAPTMERTPMMPLPDYAPTALFRFAPLLLPWEMVQTAYGASARGLHDKAVAVASRFDERLASGEQAAEGDDADDRARDRADGGDADDRARDRADGDDAVRPSVLFVMADQWRADYDGFHPAVATLELPHLSALAARGVRCAANPAPDGPPRTSVAKTRPTPDASFRPPSTRRAAFVSHRFTCRSSSYRVIFSS